MLCLGELSGRSRRQRNDYQITGDKKFCFNTSIHFLMVPSDFLVSYLRPANFQRHQRVHFGSIDDVLDFDEFFRRIRRAFARHPESRGGNAHFVKNIDIAPHARFSRIDRRWGRISYRLMSMVDRGDERLDVLAFVAFAKHKAFHGSAEADRLDCLAQLALDLAKRHRRRHAHVHVDAAIVRRCAGLVGPTGAYRADADSRHHLPDGIFDRVLGLIFNRPLFDRLDNRNHFDDRVGAVFDVAAIR
jgi:hypothetical protein